MDTRKNIVDLEAFREMLYISPRVPSQSFDELPFEEEILDFLRFFRHSAQIKTLTDVNVNKLLQPWRSFAAKPSIPRRNKVNLHYVRDDILFSTIKVVSRDQNTQKYGAILPIELTTEDIRNTKAYKEYYACATGEAAPKPKASAKRKRGGSDSSTTPPTAVASPRPIITVAAAPRLTDAAKGKQPARATTLTDPSEVERTEVEQLKIDSKGAGRRCIFLSMVVPVQMKELVLNQGEKEEETFDPIPRSPEESEDDGNGEEDQGLRVREEQRLIEEEEADELYRDTNQFAEAVSKIPGIVHQYMTQQMTEAVREAVQIQTDRLQDSFQIENDEILRTIDENMKKIIKGQVKSQVKEQVSRILPRIKESANAQLEAEVLTRSSHSSRTSYDVAADLTEMERKKILIEKMEGNKSIQRSDKQRNLREGGEPESASTPSEPATKNYGHIKWIEDLVPRTMWIQEPLNYDKHALWGVSYWGRKRQQFYGFAVNREFTLDVYSKRRIIAVTDLKIVEWQNYKNLDRISVRRDDDKINKFKEGDFKRLRLQDIEDMLLLLVQGKLSNLTVEERFAFNFSLRMFTRSIVIQRRMEDLQLGVESYQKRLNLTKPDT
nr:hypothetical protein [Tanacetum cinerariifolium]